METPASKRITKRFILLGKVTNEFSDIELPRGQMIVVQLLKNSRAITALGNSQKKGPLDLSSECLQFNLVINRRVVRSPQAADVKGNQNEEAK
jgi:hypothetical protein